MKLNKTRVLAVVACLLWWGWWLRWWRETVPELPGTPGWLEWLVALLGSFSLAVVTVLVATFTAIGVFYGVMVAKKWLQSDD